MKSDDMSVGFEMIISIIVFALALATGFVVWHINDKYDAFVRKEVEYKQLANETTEYVCERRIMSVSDVISDLNSIDESVTVKINGTTISPIDISLAKENPLLYNEAPFVLRATNNYEKNCVYNKNELITVEYTLR